MGSLFTLLAAVEALHAFAELGGCTRIRVRDNSRRDAVKKRHHVELVEETFGGCHGLWRRLSELFQSCLDQPVEFLVCKDPRYQSDRPGLVGGQNATRAHEVERLLLAD